MVDVAVGAAGRRGGAEDDDDDASVRWLNLSRTYEDRLLQQVAVRPGAPHAHTQAPWYPPRTAGPTI